MPSSKYVSFLKQKALWSFIGLLLAWLFFFWPTVTTIFYVEQPPWINWTTWGITLGSVFLICIKHADLANTLFTSSYTGILSLLGVVVFFILGNIYHVAYVEQCAVILMLPALILICFGPAVIRTILFPILYLLIVIPLHDETLEGRESIIWIAVGLFIGYWLLVEFLRSKKTEEDAKPLWVYQNARWLPPTLIAFFILMTSPWIGNNIRSFYPGKVRVVTLKAPSASQGWEGPETVQGYAWSPFYVNATASLQVKYTLSTSADHDSVYLYSAYYNIEKNISDMLEAKNFLFDPSLWKQIEAPVARKVVVGGNEMYVLEIILKAGAISRVVWYWYYISGVNTTDPSLALMVDKVRVISKDPEGSGIIYLSTSYNETADEARNRLSAFMNVMYEGLDTLKIPEITYAVASKVTAKSN